MFDDRDFDIGPFPGESADELYELTLVEHSRPWPSGERDWVPADLDSMLPDVFLAAIVSNVDLSRLPGSDVVSVLRARRRLVSHHQAGVFESMAETAHCVDADSSERSSTPAEFASEEIAAALSLTRRKADHDLGVALDLDWRLPRVLLALQRGEIDERKAVLFSTGTDILETETARSVADQLLADASEHTTGQLRARLRRLCIEADPDEAAKRYERSLSERKVVAEENPEGTAALIISQCSPDDVYSARDHINMLARRLKTDDESRSIDQLRADVAIGLLTGRLDASGTRSGSVDLHVDLTTLAGLDRNPGEIGGYGPVIAEIARKVAREQARGEWQATITDPETGEPLHVVSVRRRPSAAQKRKIRALHPQCMFLGCRMPAIDSDIDHIIDRATRGPTTVSNQAPLCRRHHLAKHRGGWQYIKITRTQCEWTSPLGHTYHTGRPP